MIKWHIKRDGATVEHFAKTGLFDLIITNFPGSRTLMWEVKFKGEVYRSATEDRFEHTVKSLKEKVLKEYEKLVLSFI